MLDTCARCRKLTLAQSIFKQMKDAGIRQSIIVYNCMINACAMCKEPHLATEYFRGIPADVMDQASLENRQIAYQSVMIAAARAGDYSLAREYFVEMTSKAIP